MKRRYVVSAVVLLALVFSMVLPGLTFSAGAGESNRHGMGLVLSKPDPALRLDASRHGLGLPMAASVDLSADLPPVGNQGDQQSCVGWSIGYYAKSWWEKQEHPSWNLGKTKYQFSPSYIYNQIVWGADQGSSILDGLSLLEQAGDTDIAEFPYDDRNYTRQPSSGQVEAAKQYRIPGDWGYFFARQTWGPYASQNDINPLKSWLESGKPLVLGIPVYDDFPDFRGSPDDDYYVYDEGSDFQGGHAIFIAGYDDNANPGGATADTRGGFLAINSWGPTWNGNGKVWLSYKFVKKYVAEAWFMEDQDSSPKISSIVPDAAGVGETVTITGNNFGAERRSAKVTFAGGVQAEAVSWQNSGVQVKVPDGAVSGKAYVYDWASEKSNGRNFTPGPGAGTSWLMAEGATWPGFDEWVLVQNPNDDPAAVTVVFLTPTRTVQGPAFELEAQSRLTVHVNEYVQNDDVATVVTSTNGVPVCTERAMYVNAPDGKWGSHDSAGVPGVSDVWYLAEGATWPGFDEWVLVMNPNQDQVDVQLTFQTPGGEVRGPLLNLAGAARASVHVNAYVPNADVSTRVECLAADTGVVAERSMYVNAPDGKRGCHNSLGSFEASAGWGLPEGATWPGYEEWVLVQNPTTSGVEVSFIFITTEEVIEGPTGSIGPGGRISVRVNDFVPDADVSTMVFTASDDQKVVAERSMYFNSLDGKRGAHNAVGSIYGSHTWYLPEGCTLPGFDEWVLVMNPDPDNAADVKLTFMTPDGSVAGPSASLPPASRMSFHVNEYVSGSVSTAVSSPGYVVCERAMYISASDGKGGATDALGILAALLGQGAGAFSTRGEEQTGLISRWRSRYVRR